MKPVCLGMMFATFIFAIFFILFSVLNYKKRFNLTYNIRNTFPYELNYQGTFKDNLAGNICLILSLLSAAMFYAFFDLNKTDGFYVFEMIAGFVSIIAIALVVFIPLNSLKAHLLSTVTLFTFTLLLTAGCVAANILRLSDLYKNFDQFNVFNLVAAIISGILCLTAIIICLNPKLKYWANLQAEPNEDGSKSFKRPKYFVLAFSEWLMIFIILLNIIPNFIGMFSF